jgi:GTP-binding protein
MVFTKMDKMSKKQFIENMNHYKEEMEKQWDELPRCFYTSAEKKEGRKELMDFISDANKVFKKEHKHGN